MNAKQTILESLRHSKKHFHKLGYLAFLGGNHEDSRQYYDASGLLSAIAYIVSNMDVECLNAVYSYAQKIASDHLLSKKY